MSPVSISVLLGLTAAAANVVGGAVIVLATALVEMVPASVRLRGNDAGFLVLVGYLIVHFFEHTVTPHFHFGEETHKEQFNHRHKGYSVLLGLVIHTFFDGI